MTAHEVQELVVTATTSLVLVAQLSLIPYLTEHAQTSHRTSTTLAYDFVSSALEVYAHSGIGRNCCSGWESNNKQNNYWCAPLSSAICLFLKLFTEANPDICGKIPGCKVCIDFDHLVGN